MYDVALLTDDRFIVPTQASIYISNVCTEDQLLMEALERQGLSVIRVSWSDARFDWEQARYALFRSTWDYAERFTQFKNWLTELSSHTEMINPYPLLQWNLDKHYLNDLQNADLDVVETLFIEAGSRQSLQQIHREKNWTKTVLKPAISAGAKDTFKLDHTNITEHEAKFRELIKAECMLLQPFQQNIVEQGEISIVVIGEKATHAVLKVAKSGDFRVQDDYGGTVHQYHPSKEEVNLALAAVRACQPRPIYARVDILKNNDDEPVVSELELIEPELWFRRNPAAADLLASKIKGYIS
ncbi:MAG: hypothetical protein AAF616_05665 [Bacteroidota bacterium]